MGWHSDDCHTTARNPTIQPLPNIPEAVTLRYPAWPSSFFPSCLKYILSLKWWVRQLELVRSKKFDKTTIRKHTAVQDQSNFTETCQNHVSVYTCVNNAKWFTLTRAFFAKLLSGLLPARSLNQASIAFLVLAVAGQKLSFGFICWRLRPVSGSVFSSSFFVKMALKYAPT